MEALGFAQHRDVGLAAHAVGEIARQNGQHRPWLEAQLGYTMSPETAARLRQARGACDATRITYPRNDIGRDLTHHGERLCGTWPGNLELGEAGRW